MFGIPNLIVYRLIKNMALLLKYCFALFYVVGCVVLGLRVNDVELGLDTPLQIKFTIMEF
ncbi:hypothetical protein GCM10011403_07970 [Pseudohongiella nitratireducens]|uniref:Uncharacterized protein n=1 Tax=Pseudohongiella nitratireducens TaxID=1768907 RepID=A0A917GPL9_9GAMM|nr:hypothetical protein GCM10011403_07970 [Pseudohongiella nitratireducens]